jgi:hypothetical protein
MPQQANIVQKTSTTKSSDWQKGREYYCNSGKGENPNTLATLKVLAGVEEKSYVAFRP